MHHSQQTTTMGPLVVPGTYQIAAAKRVDGVVTVLGSPQEVEVEPIGNPSIPPQDRQKVLAFQMKAGELQRVVTAASGKVQEVLEQLDALEKVVKKSAKADLRLLDDIRKLELGLLDVREALNGDTTRSKRSQTAVPSISRRVQNALYGTFNNTYGPTKTQRQQYEIAHEQYQRTIKNASQVARCRIREPAKAHGPSWHSLERLDAT